MRRRFKAVLVTLVALPLLAAERRDSSCCRGVVASSPDLQCFAKGKLMQKQIVIDE